MALRQLLGALGGRLLAAEAAGGQLRKGATAHALQQRRGAVAVDVVNNQVDRALKTLKRKLGEEGLPKQWKANEFHIKPSEQRKLDAAETEKRLRKRAFREKIRWILKRKSRGF